LVYIATPPPDAGIVSLRSHQTNNRPHEFEDAMMGMRRQIELYHAQHDVAARIKL